MRILFATRGSSGHVGPLIPFARACEQAGHEVRIAAQEQFAPNVERSGLRFVPFDAPPREQWMPLMGRFGQLDFREAHELMVGRFFGGLDVAAELPRLREFAREWRPEVIVRESWEFGSTLVAEERGVPIVRIGLGLSAGEEESVALAAPGVDEARRTSGLKPDPAGKQLRDGPYLTMVPAELEDRKGAATDEVHRFRYEVAREPAQLPNWWGGEEGPLVYLTFGSVAAGAHLPYFPDLYRRAVDALADLPVRILLTIGDVDRSIDELGPLPANVHAETWVSHDEAAAAALVVVCHGGFGSVLGTLARGTPMVVVPVFSSDQWDNAEAVARAGAGLVRADDRAERTALALPSSDVLDGLADAVRQVLEEDSFRVEAARIRDSMAALPPVAEAVELIVARAEGHPG